MMMIIIIIIIIIIITIIITITIITIIITMITTTITVTITIIIQSFPVYDELGMSRKCERDRIQCIAYAYALTSQTPPVTAAQISLINRKVKAVRCQRTVQTCFTGSGLLSQNKPLGQVCTVCSYLTALFSLSMIGRRWACCLQLKSRVEMPLGFRLNPNPSSLMGLLHCNL